MAAPLSCKAQFSRNKDSLYVAQIKYIKSWVFKAHKGNDNSYYLLIMRQLLFIDNSKYNKR